jgi:hypothetical protein
MAFTVREVGSGESKSVQEIESQLLAEHVPNEIKEEDVLSYLGKKYNKELKSIDELISSKEAQEKIPEDISVYLKYRNDTGRGYEDFLKLSKDYSDIDSDDLIREHLIATQEGLDSEDIDSMMEDYTFDEDYDDNSTIKKKKITKKKAVTEAKKYFESQKEMYKIPLESSKGSISDEDKAELDSYKQYISQSKTLQEENDRKGKWFDEKTDELFSSDFKGFDFNLDSKTLKYLPSDSAELKRVQSTPMNFINKFLDETGLIKDAVGYHRALSVAMNPEKFAKYFYEQGKSDATEDVTKQIKNINMSERRSPEAAIKDGFQVKAINNDSGRGLKIRSVNK